MLFEIRTERDERTLYRHEPHVFNSDRYQAHGLVLFNTGILYGQLVRLGFDVTAFTPASYQRPRLGRPSEI